MRTTQDPNRAKKIGGWRYALAVSGLALGLVGCSGDGQVGARLPSVTPVLPTVSSTPLPPLPTLVPINTPTPQPPTPTNLPLAFTDDGPLTNTMARLGLKGETFAALGDPNAKVTLIEFTDYGCPFCREYELATFPQLKSAYIDTGKVYYVVKHYPVSSQQGGIAAEAADCAGEQGRFWEMHKALFTSAGSDWDESEEKARASFRSSAETLGLDMRAFDSCMKQGREKAVSADFEQGMNLRVAGTPTFFINNKMLIGAQDFAGFSELIEQELRTQGQ